MAENSQNNHDESLKETLEWRVSMIESYLESELGRGSKSPGNVNYRSQRLEAKIKANSEDITKLNHTLRGNGKLGVATRVMIMWHSYVAIWTLLGTCLGFVGGWIVKAMLGINS